MQKEITKKTNLHKSDGYLNAGYSKRMMFEYNRKTVKAGIFSLKEWDFYQILSGDWIIQMTIGHVSYIASFSAKIISLKTGETKEFTKLSPLPFKSIKMPENPEVPNQLEAKGKDYKFNFDTHEGIKMLELQAQDKKLGKIDIHLKIDYSTENEKMVIATPFEKKNQFYLNYKENYYDIQGFVKFGDLSVDIEKDATAVLDWGRGVWPFRHEWFWGNGTANIDDGKFGFNIGWGFGDLSNATENMFFWNEKAYKLGALTVERDADDYMAPWKFKDDTVCFDFVMTPIFDNFTYTKIAFIKTQCHQVFGRYNGTATLPDGKKIIIKDMLAFCELAENRW